MYKRLRIIIPAVQLLAIVGPFVLKDALNRSARAESQRAVQVLVKDVNYPVSTVFVALVAPAEHLLHSLPRWLYTALGTAVVALLPLGIALLWYLIVTEIEARRHGKSLIRFSVWWRELPVVAILFLFGAGAFVKAHTIVVSGTASYLHLFLAAARWDEILGVLILTAWGVVLIGVAIHDLIAFLRGKTAGALNTHSP
jgi:hypothetical protein